MHGVLAPIELAVWILVYIAAVFNFDCALHVAVLVFEHVVGCGFAACVEVAAEPVVGSVVEVGFGVGFFASIVSVVVVAQLCAVEPRCGAIYRLDSPVVVQRVVFLLVFVQFDFVRYGVQFGVD